jgi:hypothetical protein
MNMTDCQQIGLCLGCAGEAVGYGGRIMLYNNVFDDNAFTIQICKLPYCASSPTALCFLHTGCEKLC